MLKLVRKLEGFKGIYSTYHTSIQLLFAFPYSQFKICLGYLRLGLAMVPLNTSMSYL